MNKKIKKWGLVFLWAGLIFFLSHQPGLKSGLPNEWDFVLRKLAHISEYFVLTLFLINALKEHCLSKKKIIILAVLLAFAYACSDEYHQTFINAREGTARDVLIDSGGILLAVYFKNFSLGRKKKKMVE
ncbi:VanZ family protein [Patescibacteria group bacterium]|nr:VanZ family protein [Patescibacteria group bacterium]